MGKVYKEYNKLVRDRIPEIIERDNKKCKIEIASKEEKYKFLEMKLQEEVNEFIEDKNLEELADVMEVIFGLANSLGYSEEDLLKARHKKKVERGGFEKGILLKGVSK
ncbi:phosphoribosyl-ATP pyrophosphohydrolase [Clostridium botulinum]|nr:phosphoribosyl-ATP pyrophosphohydrolase [Clostridium botulinum]NFS96973.1 phosphoribosyl-ATP pyrophosphohydrolase [Clostridium botulinum]